MFTRGMYVKGQRVSCQEINNAILPVDYQFFISVTTEDVFLHLEIDDFSTPDELKVNHVECISNNPKYAKWLWNNHNMLELLYDNNEWFIDDDYKGNYDEKYLKELNQEMSKLFSKSGLAKQYKENKANHDKKMGKEDLPF
jgi:hypothetical protein